jgi:hypothetical protein
LFFVIAVSVKVMLFEKIGRSDRACHSQNCFVDIIL